MKVLVTGAAGFVGSNLCETLLKDHELIGIDNFDPFYPRKIKELNIADLMEQSNFTLFEGDITDDLFVDRVMSEGIDVVVHLAAKAGVRPSIEDPLGYSNTNIKGTMTLLEAARKNGMQNFVLASSSSVYGNNKRVPFRETDNVDFPISPYAATKKSCELLAHSYAHLYGINVAALRFFTVYGRRQRPDLAIAKFTRMIDQGIEIPFFGDGTTERDYTYIDDIIDGIRKAIQWVQKQPASSYEIFNLGESQTTSLSDLVRSIEEALGKKAKKKMLPMQPGDVTRTFADITKAKKLLGYAPKTLLDEGVREYVSYYRRVLSRHAELLKPLT